MAGAEPVRGLAGPRCGGARDQLRRAGRARLARRFARGGFWPDRVNAVGLADYCTHTPGQLLAALNKHLQPRGLTAAFGGMIALVDGLIHHQDICRPLGLPCEIPAERLLPTLRAARTAPLIRGAWRTRGLRLVATDLDWTAGTGPEGHGPAEPC
jgi:hypothetical protein